MAICNSDGDVIGVVQAINKNPMGTPFTEDDEKVKLYCAGGKKMQRQFVICKIPFVVCASKCILERVNVQLKCLYSKSS